MSGSQEAASTLFGRAESGNEKNDLTGSEELTSATASVSDDEVGGALVGGWFGDIKSLAQSTKNTLIPGIQAIGNVIHNSAMAVAAEIAQLERDADGTEHWGDGQEYPQTARSATALRLPWEVISADDESKWIEDEALKAKMFAVSTEESTFLQPFSATDEAPSDDSTNFQLDPPRVHLIRKLLDLDHNLASLHAKLSGRSDIEEATFWKNYFYHCERLRQSHVRLLSTPNDDDDDDDVQSRSTLGSLVPAGDSVTGGGVGGEENSYVCVRNSVMSPPSSLNTLGTLSVGDMVLVQTPSGGADSGDEL